ncbi:MAG: kinase, partial [Erysipelotrichales bacterium]|nr:kinase [Erysipelotrichales bacterium]
MGKICVIGGANVDILGSSVKPVVPGDSNIGHITYSFGGVGRNIAENLALLGHAPVFVSVFGNDPIGEDMYRYCQAVGMDLSYSVKTDQVSSTYLAVLDDKNDMIAAINDMHILDLFTPETVQPLVESLT